MIELIVDKLNILDKFDLIKAFLQINGVYFSDIFYSNLLIYMDIKKPLSIVKN